MYDYASAFTIIYKRKSIFLLHREFDHILNMQKYVTHNFHGQKMDVGFNLALFIFHPQLLRRFSEKEKYKTGNLANSFSDIKQFLFC